MSVYDDIVRAIHDHRRRLVNYVSPVAGMAEVISTRGTFNREQIERMLRVEVSDDCLDDIMGGISPNARWYFLDAERAGEPWKIMGVAVYLVRGLKVPGGWRIINPMEKA